MGTEGLSEDKWLRGLLGDKIAENLFPTLDNFAGIPKDVYTASETKPLFPQHDETTDAEEETVHFYTDSDSGTVVREVVDDDEEATPLRRRFRIDAGVFKFGSVLMALGNDNSAKSLSLNFDYSPNLTFDLDTIQSLTRTILPSVISPTSQQNSTDDLLLDTTAFIQRTDKDKPLMYNLRSNYNNFTEAFTASSQTISHVEMSTVSSKLYVPKYRFIMERKDGPLGHALFHIIMPKGYEWTPQVAEFAFANHRRMDSSLGSHFNAQGLADTLNYVSMIG